MSKATNKFSPEVRARAMRMGAEHEAEHPSGTMLRIPGDVATTWQGFVYVASVIGAFARRIIGWRVSRAAHASFVLDALEPELHDRRPAHRGGLIKHLVGDAARAATSDEAKVIRRETHDLKEVVAERSC